MPPKEDPTLAFADPVLQQQTAEPLTKRTQLSDVVMAKSDNPSDQDLWWIHGNGYDLKRFVERHPGGKEAILLGKGRDCTALVESYHAFSPHHAKILEKYLCKPRSKTSSQSDPFYEVLKQRTAAALRAKGIDPVQDRGAGWLRMSYYVVIVSLVFATGYMHIKVSVVQYVWKRYKRGSIVPILTLFGGGYSFGTIREVSWVLLDLLFLVG